jgi:hypothetical protein
VRSGLALRRKLLYLPDRAPLEAAFHRALLAPDDEPWDQVALTRAVAVDAGGAGRVRLRLGAAVGLLASGWPVYEIWRRHREGRPTGSVPAGTGDRLVICRSGYTPRVQPVSGPVSELLGGILGGLGLADLVARGLCGGVARRADRRRHRHRLQCRPATGRPGGAGPAAGLPV